MKFKVRVICNAFEDIEVEADNEEDAKEKALIEFNCPGAEGEVSEIKQI